MLRLLDGDNIEINQFVLDFGYLEIVVN